MKGTGQTKAEIRKGRKARKWKGTKFLKNEDARKKDKSTEMGRGGGERKEN
jgi:ribosomal protein L6P/L9E